MWELDKLVNYFYITLIKFADYASVQVCHILTYYRHWKILKISNTNLAVSTGASRQYEYPFEYVGTIRTYGLFKL